MVRPMNRIFATAALILLGLAPSACSPAYTVPSHGISDDLYASHWNGPTSLNPGRSLSRPDDTEGSNIWRR